MNTVRLLMLGVGGMGRAHMRNLLNVQGAEIVGLVDPSTAAIETTLREFPTLENVPTFSEVRQAIEAVEADGAIIVTPHSQHFDHGMTCLNAGLHVLMEKPFVAGSERAKQIIEHAKNVNRHLVVGYQRHLQGPFLYLRNLVQQGQLGDIQFITAYQAQGWLEGCRGTWRQDPELSCGGQLNDSGSHLLDVVLWLTGLEPEEVRAYIDNRGTRVDIDTALTVRFEGGALCTFNVVGSANIGWWEDLSIHGTAGSALYRNGQLMVSKGHGSALVPISDNELPASSDPDQNFVDLIRGHVSEAAAPAHCGYLVSRLTEAAWQSAELGQSVRF